MSTLDKINDSFEKRDYQEKALEDLKEFFFKWVKGILENEIRYYEDEEGEENEIEFLTSALIHMATGSGKTYTVGSFIEYIFSVRERFVNTKRYQNIPPLKILALGDQIEIIDQLKEGLIDGNSDKGYPAIFSNTFKKTLNIEKKHSRTKIDDILKISGSENKNEVVFSTFQTAKNNIDVQRDFNIILIDEAHHLTAPEYKAVFEKFYKPFDSGNLGAKKLPLVFCMTATATSALKKLTGKAIIDFALPRFLASKYSPKVEYNLITNDKISQETLSRIQNDLKRIKNIDKINEKRAELKFIEEELDNSLFDFESDDYLIKDLHNRIPNIKNEKTILFVPSIEKANEVATQINAAGHKNNIAYAYHSQTKENNILSTFSKKNSQTKILIVIDKLNEGVDMPFVDNVVFWRNTNSAILFEQQFGRGLRGKLVKFYDYVGGVRNLVWVDNLIHEVREISSTDISRKNNIEVSLDGEKIKNSMDNLISGEINIYNIMGEIRKIKESFEYPMATKEQIIMFYEKGDIKDINISKIEYTLLARSFNLLKSSTYKIHLPQTWKTFIRALGFPSHIKVDRNSVIRALKGESIESIFPFKEATKQDLIQSFSRGEIDIKGLSKSKYKEYYIEWNEKNSKILEICFPNHRHKFLNILGLKKGEEKLENIEIILGGKQLENLANIQIATKEDALLFFKDGEILPEHLTGRKWKERSRTLRKEYEIQFPESLEGFITLLLGAVEVKAIKDSKRKIPRDQETAIHLLSESDLSTLENKKAASKKDIMGIQEAFPENLTNKTLKQFIKENKLSWAFELQRSLNGLISVLGGDKKVSSGAKYFFHLLNGGGPYEEFEKPVAQLKDIVKLVKNRELTEDHFARKIWDLQRHNFNLSFKLPCYEALVYIITGYKRGEIRASKELLIKYIQEEIRK